jgi:hypothetical protein
LLIPLPAKLHRVAAGRKGSFVLISQDLAVTIITARRRLLCYGEFGRDSSMDEYKLHREHRIPVGPNRLSHLTEVVTAVAFVLVAIYFLR